MTLRRSLAVALAASGALLASACTGFKSPEGWAPPAIVEDSSIAIVSLRDDRVSAVDLASGEELWGFPDEDRFADQRDIDLEAVYGEPVIDGDTIYFADYDGQVFAVNREDGALVWRRDSNISGKIVDGPVASGELLAFADSDGHVYVVNKTDGAPAPGWERDGLDIGAGVWARPIFGEDVLYVATMEGDVHALNVSDGSEAWAAPFDQDGAIADLTLLEGGRLFAPALDNRVHLIDAQTGQPIGEPFEASDWVWTEPAYRDGTVYFGDFEGQVYALDITDGGFTEKWSTKVQGRVKAGPVLVGEMLVVGTRDTVVYFLNSGDGSVAHFVPIRDSGTIRAELTAYEGRGLVLTTNGDLCFADPVQLRIIPVRGCELQ